MTSDNYLLHKVNIDLKKSLFHIFERNNISYKLRINLRGV